MGVVLLGAGLSILLIATALYRCHQRGDDIASILALPRVMEAIGLGGSLAGLIAVSILGVALFQHPGTTIEANLPLGLGQDAVVGLLFAASILGTCHCAKSYIEASRTPRDQHPVASPRGRRQQRRR